MGEVVPARTSPTLHPPSPPTVLWLPFEKCLSASIVVTSTLRVKVANLRGIYSLPNWCINTKESGYPVQNDVINIT